MLAAMPGRLRTSDERRQKLGGAHQFLALPSTLPHLHFQDSSDLGNHFFKLEGRFGWSGIDGTPRVTLLIPS